MVINHFRASGLPNILFQHHRRRQVELIEKKLWQKRERERKRHIASAEPGWGHCREDWIQVIKSGPKINLFHQALGLVFFFLLFFSVPLYSELTVKSVTSNQIWSEVLTHDVTAPNLETPSKSKTPTKSWHGIQMLTGAPPLEGWVW